MSKKLIILLLLCILLLLSFMKEPFVGFKSYGIYDHQLDPSLFPILPKNFVYNNKCNNEQSIFPIVPNNFIYINK